MVPDIWRSLKGRIQEYCGALGTPWTYMLHRNPYAVSGFLWGLPVPTFAVLLAQWASGNPLSLADCCARLISHPVFLVLAIHPFLFAILFGAFGTIREEQSRQIQELIRHLEDLAHTDGLTGLFNHQYFKEVFPRLLKETVEKGKSVALAEIDLDGLKSINDGHGHGQGDLVLARIGRLIIAHTRSTDLVARTGGYARTHIRPADLAARTGGDEFAILMPSTTLTQAARIAERIRSAVSMESWTRADGQGRLDVSVSIGVASADGGNAEALLKAADLALYQAKERGRNQVVMWE